MSRMWKKLALVQHSNPYRICLSVLFAAECIRRHKRHYALLASRAPEHRRVYVEFDKLPRRPTVSHVIPAVLI